MIRYENGEEQCNMKYQYQGNHLYRYMEDELVDVDFGADTVTMLPSVLRFESLKPWLALHEYDANGNVTKDRERGLDMSYNCLNLLEYASDNDANAINYCYLADGTKLSATTGDDCGFAYRGSFTYRADAGGDRVFESTPFGGGRIVATAGNDTEIRYFLTDHLESVRVVATDKNNVLERNDYYPFGKRWDTASLPVSDNRDRFNGKEDQVFIGDDLADYGARCYNKLNGRWLAQDPKAENFINSSQYCFCGNNPISRIDINGEDWYSYQKKEYNEQGEMIEYTVYAYTEATSQQELDDAGINGTYLGEVAVIFNGSEDERLGEDGTLTGKNANPAIVTIYGKNGSSDIQEYNGLTISSNPNIYPMIEAGDYKAFHEQMSTSVYGKDALTYRITTLNGNLLIPPAGGTNKRTGMTYISGEYFHRTDWNGKATKASQACLVIDGRTWKKVEKQIGTSHNIFI
ncbi:hypothetical protein F2R72_15115 [Alistipes onderdonkii]|nr:hypothetical protein F2R72_15115 [Alistipes onderdonkii]